MRLMHDSVNARAIPTNAEMVAGYVDGRYAWSQADWDRFPNSVKVTISAIGQRTAQVGDVEVGCIWPPANAVPWVIRARRDGYDPTIYVNELNDWGAVRQAFRDARVPEPHYWTARYNGVRSIPAGAVARQFAHPHDGDGVADKPWETGGHFDLSAVLDYWPGVDNGGPGGGGGNEDDMDQTQNDSLLQTEAYTRELWQVLVDGTYVPNPDPSKFNQDLGYVLDELPKRITVPVTLTEADRDAIAERVRLGLLEDLQPLFDLAQRLES